MRKYNIILSILLFNEMIDAYVRSYTSQRLHMQKYVKNKTIRKQEYSKCVS